jgi:hypothetical protein
MATYQRWILVGILLFVAVFGVMELRQSDVTEAASGSLTTTYAATNFCLNSAATGYSGGVMFDIVATNTITITSFDTHIFSAGTFAAKIYYKNGSHVGSENNPAAWTLLGTTSVTSTGYGNPAPVNIGGLTIYTGQTVGVYLIVDTGLNMMTTGTQSYSNGDIQINSGIAMCSTVEYDPGYYLEYIWNGTVYYDLGAPPAPPGPDSVESEIPAFNPNDDRLNQAPGDEGEPVAIYQGSVDVYGIDPMTSQGVLDVRVTDAEIELVGIPSETEWSRLLERGENRATGMPIEVYRLATGEFQVNTYYPSGKPYIFRWHPERPTEGVHVAW